MSIEFQAQGNKTIVDNQHSQDRKVLDTNQSKDQVNSAQLAVSIKPQDKVEASSQSVEISDEKVNQAVSQLKDYAEKYQREIRFSVDQESGRTVVRLLDNNNKVLRQIPSEDLLNLAKSIEQNKGLFFKDEV